MPRAVPAGAEIDSTRDPAIYEQAYAELLFGRESGVRQAQKKYGDLVIYVGGYNEEVDCAADALKVESERTCEGVLRLRPAYQRWVSTLCADCGSLAM